MAGNSIFIPPPLDPDSEEFRRSSLKTAVMYIAYCEIISGICYIPLYFLVRMNNIGELGFVIQIMTLVAGGVVLIVGLLVLFGAIYENAFIMEIAVWFIVIGALYRTILGFIGGIHYARKGHLTVHYVLSFVYFANLCTVLGIICQDFKIINIYKQVLQDDL